MLKGSHRQQLHAAFLSAFPRRSSLEQLALFRLDLHLSQIVNDNASLQETVFALIEWAETHGQLRQLVEAARESNPTNPELVEAAGTVLAAMEDDKEAQDDLAALRAREQQRLAEEARMPHREGVPTHPDRPATSDELGRYALAEVLADRLRRLRGEDPERPGTSTPGGEALIVHVHAPWGAGKSSLLGFLREALESPRDTTLVSWIPIEFNAWRHQRLAPPWWWLLTEIRRDGLEALQRRSHARAAWFRLRDLRWRAWNARPLLIAIAIMAGLATVAWSTDGFGLSDTSLTGLKAASTALTAIFAVTVTLWAFARGVGKWVAFGASPPGMRLLQRAHDPLRASQQRFDFLVNALNAPLVVLVDDLDRCRSDFAVELLEGIQTLFLHQPVVYVVAADREWLCASYEQVYSGFRDTAGDSARPLGLLFLEKTFQISLEIPPLGDATRNQFWRGLVRGQNGMHEDPADPGYDEKAAQLFSELTSIEEIENALEGASAESAAQTEAFRRAAMRRLNSPGFERDLEHALERYAHLVEPNPRAMKRLVNAYGVERALRVRSGMVLGPGAREQNVLWMIVRLRWPRLADHLAKDPLHADLLAAPTTPADLDVVPAALRPVFNDREVRRVFEGQGIGVALDAHAVRQFLTFGSNPSTIGA